MAERMSSVFTTSGLCELCRRDEPCDCADGPCQCSCGDCQREEPTWLKPPRWDEMTPGERAAASHGRQR